MKNKKNERSSKYRKHAEEQLKTRLLGTKPAISSKADMLKIIHELEVSGIELEMQNEELILAREANRERVEKYTDLYDHAPTGHFTLSKDGNINELNLTAAKMLGTDRDRLKTIPFATFISIESRTAFTLFLLNVFNDGGQAVCNLKMTIGGGEKAYVHLTGVATPNSLECRVTVTDLTDGKEPDEEMRLSEDHYRSLFSSNYSVMLLVDPETGQIRDANPAACRYYGWSHGEICRMVISEINTLSVQELFDEMQLAILENRNHFFFRHRLAGGEIRDVEVYSGPINFGAATLLYSIVHDISLRSTAEIALKKSEALYRGILRASPDNITITDMEGCIRIVSLSAVSMFGYSSPEEFTGHSLMEFLVPEDRPRAQDAIKQMFSGIPYRGGEYRVLRRDGTMFEIETNGDFIRDGEGNPTHMVLIIRDITSRKKDEEAFKLKTAILSNLIVNLQEGILLEDADRKITLTNQLFCDMFGIPASPEAMIGADCLNAAEESQGMFMDPVTFMIKINKVLDEKKPVFSEILDLKDGRHFERDYIPIYLDDQYNGHLWKYRDITGKVHAEDDLRKLSRAVEQSPVMNVITDLEGNIEYVNPRVLSLTGYTREELIGQDTGIFRADEPSITDFKTLWLTITSGNEWKGEFRNRKKDGTIYWVAASIAPVIDAKGKTTHYIAIQEDITERKKTEELLVSSEKNLNYAQEMAHMGNWSLDLKDNITTWSLNYFNILGLDPVTTKPDYGTFLSIVHPDDRHLLDITREEIGKGMLPSINFDMRLVMADGTVKWVQSNVVSTFENGELVYLKGVNVDITDKKQSEERIRTLNSELEQKITLRTHQLSDTNENLQMEVNERSRIAAALRETLDRLHKIADRVPGVLYQYRLRPDGSGCFPFASEGIRDIYDVAPRDVEEDATAVFDRLHPADRGTVVDSILASAREMKLWRHDYRVIFGDGSVHWVSGNAMPQQDIDGSVLWHGFITDITDRKAAEDLLKMATTRLTLAASAGKVGVWDYDVESDILVWDAQMFDLYGIKEEDFSGAYEAWVSGLHPDDKARGDEEIRMAICCEKDFDTEFRVLWPDGSIRNLKAQAIVQRDERGKALHLIGTNWDITEQKNTEIFQHELLQLSLQLAGVSGSEISGAIDMALSRVGGFLGVDRAYIYEFDKDEQLIHFTHEWCGDGIISHRETHGEFPVHFFLPVMSLLKHHEMFNVPNMLGLSEEHVRMQKVLNVFHIKSLLILPILIENRLIGFVGLNSESRERRFEPYECKNLEMWSNLIAGLINKERASIFLEQTRQNYETFFNSIDDFLFVLDEQGNIIHTNKTVQQRLGYPDIELMGKSVLMVHPEGRREEAGRIVGDMLRGVADFCPVPLITRAGQEIPVETRVGPGQWDGRAVLFGVSKDISKIKLSEEKFSRAFHSNSSLMAISSFREGKFLEVNDAFLKTLEYSRDEVIGKSSSDLHLFIDPAFRGTFTTPENPAGFFRDLELEVSTKSGIVLTGLFSGEPFFIGGEECWLTVMVDITVRKRDEEEIKKARREAEEANKAKSEFLSRMSHELRTPMNSILGFAQLMEMGQLTPMHKKGVSHILTSGRHLLNLINEVLDISRIEAGRIILASEPVPLKKVILEMMDVVHPEASRRNISVMMESSPVQDITVMTDPQRFRQVLLNLINNAIKYNVEGGSVFIAIAGCKSVMPGEPRVRISVQDTGPGIRQEDLEKLFIPFERIGAEKTSTEGSGLGLSVAKKIMDALGGKVGVDSIPGQGSTFWIEMPGNTDLQSAPPAMEDVFVQESEADGKCGTVLYIEDNIPNAELVEGILGIHRPALRLVTSALGNPAVELAKKNKPGLILLDLDLPDLPGLEVLGNLLLDKETCNIPVVIISADAIPRKIKLAMDSGARDFLTKPINVKTFLLVVDSWLTDDNH